jgi:amino acid adenylation domain-containing protein
MAYLLQQLLSETAQRYPDQIAVVCQDEVISYAKLEELSNRLGNLLIAEGVQVGDRVGFYLHKSIETVICIFAILKAGGVYVPLDPQAPAKRLAYIINNSGIQCLISSSKKLSVLRPHASELSSLESLILVDQSLSEMDLGFPKTTIRTWEVVQGCPPSSPQRCGISTDLAYILYTSGSTGNPKGVMLTHLNAFTFIDWAHECFRIEPQDRLSNHAPFHFDLSIFDLFVAIKAGATVCLIPEIVLSFPTDLAHFIERHRITVWYSVPSALIHLLLYTDLRNYNLFALRLVLFAGEVFPVKYLRGLKQLIPHAEFYNLYGPTETNVCTFYHVKEIAQDRIQPFPIGKACANTEVFAVNDKNERIKPGEIGELYVRGASVTMGYWGLPEKTQQALLPNIFQPAFEEKVYRTDDLVTLDEDGNYIFIARKDHMIKSRGYRIELGEIEVILFSHPKVKEAAVIGVPDDQIGNRIKAFIVPQDATVLSGPEIKHYCLERLPKYMVPEIIEFRSVLPKTSTGKIDKVRLGQEDLHSREGD